MENCKADPDELPLQGTSRTLMEGKYIEELSSFSSTIVASTSALQHTTLFRPSLSASSHLTATMSETMETMQARHRKEAKELQNKITQKKKQATKKTRKGVNDECARLEVELKEKQVEELAALHVDGFGGAPEDGSDSEVEREEKDGVEEVEEKLTEVKFASDTKAEPQPEEQQTRGPKRNRQKERLARRAAEAEEASKKAEEEALLQPNWKKQERTAMIKAFALHNLVEKEIRPDGHCMFSAIGDQLAALDIDIGAANEAEKSETFRYKAVRRAAALYILEHKEDFQDFMEEPIISYVSKIERTAEWGGHLELVALAKSYNVEINVIQDGKTNKIEPEQNKEDTKKIYLAYYHHGYGLGEHYNSLRPAKAAQMKEGAKGDSEEVAP